MRHVLEWLRVRFEPEDTVLPVLRHPVPAELDGRVGWWYVLGSATLSVFIVQVITGVALAMTYVPAPISAYQSLLFITYEAPLGGFVRAMHYWGAGAMVLLALLHMTQVFLFGAYKFPREANWMSGSLLLLVTLAMAFTGQLLRWDQDAFWSIVVAAQQAARAPFIGEWAATLVIAGEHVGGATLTRFYATHVFLIPAATFGLLALHLYLVIKRGISEPPSPGERVEPATYRERYERILARGIPFYPDFAWRDAVASVAVVLVLAVLSILFGAPLGEPPDPTVVNAHPRPDWYFVGYFGLLAVIPEAAETLVIIGLPLFAFAFLFLLPLWRPAGERHWSRRPLSIAIVAIPAIAYVALTWAGFQSPWAPLIAEDESAFPAAFVETLSDPEREGADLYVRAGCWSCHRVAGSGGTRGPDLTFVADRLTAAQLTSRILTGGGGMPSYAGTLTPAQVESIVLFLEGRRR